MIARDSNADLTKTPGPAARWLALGLGPTHAPPAKHDHMGRTYPCGLYVGREQGSSRAAPRQVTTMPGDEVNCPGCIEAAEREAVPTLCSCGRVSQREDEPCARCEEGGR